MRLFTFAVFACGVVATARLHGAIVTVSDALSSNNEIDDPPGSGIARTVNVSASFTQITDIHVTLDIGSADGLNAWNGDLYAHLSGPSGTLAVLLNQTGVSSLNAAGYGNAGFSITLHDSLTNPDVHTYQEVSYSLNGSGQLTGTWNSDGRALATDSTRSNPLSSFAGENPNGTWTLLVADLATGNTAKLNSWSLTIEGGAAVQGGSAVPEPISTSLGSAIALLAGAILRRRRTRANPMHGATH